MPIYEFLCPVHGVFEELMFKFEGEKDAHCPECGSLASKVMSSFSFTLAPPQRDSKAVPGAKQVRR